MKKVLSFLTAVVLTVAMSVNVMAAPSPSTPGQLVSGDTTITFADGTTADGGALKLVETSNSAMETAAAASSKVSNASLVDFMQLSYSGSKTVGSIDAEIAVSSNVKNGAVTIAFLPTGSSEWIYITATVKDGVVDVTLPGTGYIAFFQTATSSDKSTDKKSPKTSDTAMMGIISMVSVAMAGLGIYAVTRVVKKEN